MLETLERSFQSAGLHLRIVAASGTHGIRDVARAAVDNGENIIVAGGGDGTVSAVAGVLAGTQAAMGVLPLGTLNHFAKDLGVPLELERAVQTLAAGRTALVDTGEVNGRVFVNNSSIGLYPVLVEQRELRRRLGFGRLRALASGAAAALRWHRNLQVHIDADGNTCESATPFVFVGNNRYVLDSLEFGSRRRLDEGVLSVYLLTGTGRLEMLRLAACAVTGRLREARGFESLMARRVTIRSRRRRLLVAADGEAAFQTAPLEYRIRPRALRVLVP